MGSRGRRGLWAEDLVEGAGVGVGHKFGVALVRDAMEAESLALDSVRAATVAVSFALASTSCAMVDRSVVEVAAKASR